MRSNPKNVLALLAACGMAVGVSQMASAQPFVVNVSGATLMENTIKAPASTNDYIDVDGDGTAGSLGSFSIDQLAPFGVNPFVAGQWWCVQYRVVGSVNGLQELIDYGTTFATGAEGVEIAAITASLAYYNRSLYINAGVSSAPFYNAANPGGAPVRGDTTTYAATLGTGAGTGIQVDVAPVDVPSRWALRSSSAGTTYYGLKPGEPGYGRNDKTTVNKDGSPNGFDHLLANIGGLNLFDPDNPGAADGNTLFDTPFAYAPISVEASHGTGLQQIKMSDLRHLSVTGRDTDGENFIMVTRDSGSGTRNGFQNSIGVEPSWGMGENIGGLSTLANANIVGAAYSPSNKGGSSGVDNTITSTRLGIGYSGAERAVTGSTAYITTGRAEALAVQNDVPYGGTVYARPNIDAILDSGINGFVIGGPGTLVTVGDPRAEALAAGGDANGNPQMRNPHAASWMNNITRSIEEFVAVPGGAESEFMPGEIVATLLILTDALEFLQSPTDPTDLIVNPAVNSGLSTYLRSNSSLANAALYTYGTVSLNGRVPTRQTGTTYSDGVVNGTTYINQGGATVVYAANLTNRNRVAGDFNGDGLRNWNDSVHLISAWRQRTGGPAWVAPGGTGAIAGAPGTDAIIEVLGDFNCDGNFNSADVRYWADGLAMDPVTGKLNRAEGFARVDSAFGGNFFGTMLGNPSATYDNGDSAADIAGPSGFQAPGWAPVGADGVVNAYDIDFVYKQFAQNPNVTDGALNWNNLDEAVCTDLSADIDGNLIVDIADVKRILDILETGFGDVDLNGDVTISDYNIVFGNIGMSGGWAMGDMNGDGLITQDDLNIVIAVLCPGNANRDGTVNFDDINSVIGNWLATYPCSVAGPGDANFDGIVNFDDINAAIGNWLSSCP